MLLRGGGIMQNKAARIATEQPRCTQQRDNFKGVQSLAMMLKC